MHSVGKFLAATLLFCGIAACDADDVDTRPTEEKTDAVAQVEERESPAPRIDMQVFEPWTGDLPAMLERRLVRVLVPWSDTYYYLDGVNQRGIAYEAAKTFETWLNKEMATGVVKIHVAILPVRRDQLLQFVASGRGDLALGGITVTDHRAELVEFTDPPSREVQEWLIEGSTAEQLGGIDDLAGRSVHVRASSSYWETLTALNADFAARDLQPIELVAAPEYLSTEDLMQLANAGAIPYTVADHEIAQFWANGLPDLRVRDDIILREGAAYAWALRKESPEFKALLNRFIKQHKRGTLAGNMVANRYLKDTSRLHRVDSEEDLKRMLEVRDYFKQHAAEYEFDALMMLAQGFQESRLDQSKRSHRGAVGIMQVLPSTAADPSVGIADISSAENNILAGIRYMAWIRDNYFDDPELDEINRTALAFASYNAGPNRVRGLRAKAAQRGLDPNVWFDNVEVIAAEDIGRETVDYVANIYKYYMAYRLADVHRSGP